MFMALPLLFCLITGSEGARSGDFPNSLRLKKGHELVYKGTFTEETIHNSTIEQRNYFIETRLFVMEASVDRVRIAACTTLKCALGPKNGGGPDSVSVRLGVRLLDLS